MPSQGWSKVSPAVKEEFRRRYAAGETSRILLKQFPASESLFWLIVKGLRTARMTNTHDTLCARYADLDDVHRGWIAGIVDGEGWIGITKLRGTYYQPRISVQSTTHCMQLRLAELLGGNVRKTKRKPPDRDIYEWTIWSIPRVRAVLTQIIPLLVVKKRVAETVLAHCERHSGEFAKKPTREDERAYQRVRQLNKRGTRG